MKKKILAIVVPSLSIVTMCSTGFGFYVANMYDSGSIDDVDFNIKVDSLITNEFIDVKLNQSYGDLKLVDPSNVAQTDVYSTVTDQLGNTSQVLTNYAVNLDNNPINNEYALDFTWKVDSFINDFMSNNSISDLQWKKLQNVTGEEGKYPIYLPSFATPVIPTDPNDPVTYEYKTVLVPYQVKLTVETTFPKELTPCLDISIYKDVDDGSGHKSKVVTPVGTSDIGAIAWDDSDNSVFTSELYMNECLTTATSEMANLSSFDASSYSTFKNNVKSNYDKKVFSKYDSTVDPARPNRTTVNGFFGCFSVKPKRCPALDSDQSDFYSAIECLNNLKTSAINDGLDAINLNINIKVKKIEFIFATAETADVGGASVEVDENKVQSIEVNENMKDLFGESLDKDSTDWPATSHVYSSAIYDSSTPATGRVDDVVMLK